MSSDQSEIARIRQAIASECDALRLAFSGPAVTASHAIIEARFKQIEDCTNQLSALVGESEATTTAIDIYIDIVK